MKLHWVLLMLFTTSLRLHLYFCQLEFEEFTAGIIKVEFLFFVANLLSGFHS